jgi:hypothetical protein
MISCTDFTQQSGEQIPVIVVAEIASPILTAWSCAHGATLLVVCQGGIASSMGSNKLLRSLHAFLGTFLVSTFVLHAGTARLSSLCPSLVF